MLPVGEVLPGVVVFLDCGCLGRRGISPPDGGVLVIIEKRCAEHAGPDEVRRLLESGADPNAGSGFYTALGVAAAHGNTTIVSLLLEAGANADWHAVQVAAFGNHAKTLRLLLTAGVDPNGPRGETPLLNTLHYSGFGREQQARVRELLREAGARELPDWYLRWRWSIRYGWRWRLRRFLYSLGWQPTPRRRSK